MLANLAAVGADTEAMSRLAKQLRQCSPAGAKAFRSGLREAGELVKQKAAANASYSSRIPGSLKVRATGRGNVNITAGGAAAPNGAPIENRGRGHVRHPIFGRGDRSTWRWTEKNSHPSFLFAALLEMSPAALKVAGSAMERAVSIALRG